MNSHVVGKVPRLARVVTFAALCIAGGLALTAVTASAQERQLTGRVVDADGNAPVPGAAVTVLGTALGAITNDSGQFHIRVPSTAVTLSARRIGYTPRNVPVAADHEIERLKQLDGSSSPRGEESGAVGSRGER